MADARNRMTVELTGVMRPRPAGVAPGIGELVASAALPEAPEERQLPWLPGRDAQGRPVFLDLAAVSHVAVVWRDPEFMRRVAAGLLASVASFRSPLKVRFALIPDPRVDLSALSGSPWSFAPGEEPPVVQALAWMLELGHHRKNWYQRYGARTHRTYSNLARAEPARVHDADPVYAARLVVVIPDAGRAIRDDADAIDCCLAVTNARAWGMALVLGIPAASRAVDPDTLLQFPARIEQLRAGEAAFALESFGQRVEGELAAVDGEDLAALARAAGEIYG